MARVHPEMEQLRRLPVPLLPGELQVLDTLRALGDGWSIYVQPRLGLDQPDFVVIHPDHGVVVIEVRDWRPGLYRRSPVGDIEVRSSSGWERAGEVPRYVVHRTAILLQERFFADTNDPPRDPSVRPMLVLVRQSAEEVQALVGAPSVTPSELRVRCLSGAELRAATVEELVGPPSPRRRAVSARNLARLVRHLDQPVAVDEAVDGGPPPAPADLDGLAAVLAGPGRGIRPVRGAAGTGKTTGLVARASELARLGRDVLVVTGTPHHAVHLHGQILERCHALGADPRRVTSIHLVGLCARVADDARVAGFRRLGGPRRSGGPVDGQELAERAVRAYQAGIGPRFDDVLVDQGEDLTALQWSLLRLLARRDEQDGEVLLLTDPTQRLSGPSMWSEPANADAVGLLVDWTLAQQSHRLPADLAVLAGEFARSHLTGDVLAPEPLRPPASATEPSGSTRRWVDAPPGAAIGKLLGDEVVRLLEDAEDLRPDEVLFIAPSHRAGTDATSTIRAAGLEVQHVFGSDQRDGQRRRDRFRFGAPGVKGCTAAEAKGLEARAVVVAIPAGRHGHTAAYVGLTRVRDDGERPTYVTVVNQDASLRGFGHVFAARAPEARGDRAVPPLGAELSPPAGSPAGPSG